MKFPWSKTLNFDAVRATKVDGKKCKCIKTFKSLAEAEQYLEEYKKNNICSKRYPPFIEPLLFSKKRVYHYRVLLPIV